jgi:hypothetical protein
MVQRFKIILSTPTLKICQIQAARVLVHHWREHAREETSESGPSLRTGKTRNVSKPASGGLGILLIANRPQGRFERRNRYHRVGATQTPPSGDLGPRFFQFLRNVSPIQLSR